MPRKLLAAIILASGCASTPEVAPPSVQVRTCPALAPSIPCSADKAEPRTLSELRAAWLTAQANAEDCLALADEWMRRWDECLGADEPGD